MEKRAIIAVILSIAVFYAFTTYFPAEHKQLSSKVVSPIQSKNSTATISQQPISEKIKTVSPITSEAKSPAGIDKDIIVENKLYRAVFSSRGGSLKSITLKNYKEQNTATASKVTLGNFTDPALLTFSTKAIGFNLPSETVFSSNTESLNLIETDKKQLIFNYISDQGFTARKIYTFDGNSYSIKLDTEVLNNSAIPITGALQTVMTYTSESNTKDKRFETAGSYIYSDSSLKADKAKDVASSSKKYDKNIQWAGFADKYFLTAILAEKNSIASVELKKNLAGFMESVVSSPQFTINPGYSSIISNYLFVGPKDIDVLKAQHNSLEQSLDLGWFSAIAKPLLYALKFFYQYVGNYGLAIIIITIILKLIFFPLTHKSYKSMKSMQLIQPEMNKIREKHKNDRDGMNKAVMELYREHKVNPLGGCLPMIVQIPVFFALYKSLMFSIELRHAPFFFWITDLADKDPYYVTPVIMGISMFIQQKMTPSQMDPIQQKMMLALPVVFTFMFLSFPSGLVLYWLVNNILTIGQQMYINKPAKA